MDYGVNDLIDLAVSLEREGAEFYEWLSQMAKNKSTKMIFKNFADDERRHEEIFLKLKHSDIAVSEISAVDNMIRELVEQLSHEDVFIPVAEENVENIHPLTAIKLGIKTEKNTVKLYKQILKRIRTSTWKKTLEELIKEEKQHTADLTELHKNKAFDF